jgi:hypothetical protein
MDTHTVFAFSSLDKKCSFLKDSPMIWDLLFSVKACGSTSGLILSVEMASKPMEQGGYIILYLKWHESEAVKKLSNLSAFFLHHFGSESPMIWDLLFLVKACGSTSGLILSVEMASKPMEQGGYIILYLKWHESEAVKKLSNLSAFFLHHFGSESLEHFSHDAVNEAEQMIWDKEMDRPISLEEQYLEDIAGEDLAWVENLDDVKFTTDAVLRWFWIIPSNCRSHNLFYRRTQTLTPSKHSFPTKRSLKFTTIKSLLMQQPMMGMGSRLALPLRHLAPALPQSRWHWGHSYY